MKKSLLIFSSLAFAFSVQLTAQSYTLLHATQSMKRGKSGKVIVIGEKLDAAEMISFKDASDKAAVLQNGKGIFLLKTPSTSTTTQITVKSGITELPKGMSNRTKPVQTLADVINCFGEKTLLSGQMSIYFGKFPFALTDSNYFFVNIKSGEKEIRKRLLHRNDTVYFFEAELKQSESAVNGVTETKAKIFYKVNNNIVTITETTFISPAQEDLKKDALLINEMMGKGYEGAKISAFGNYLNEFYGKCDETDIKALMKNLIITEKKQ